MSRACSLWECGSGPFPDCRLGQVVAGPGCKSCQQLPVTGNTLCSVFLPICPVGAGAQVWVLGAVGRPAGASACPQQTHRPVLTRTR